MCEFTLPYTKLEAVKEGDFLIADGGFECMRPGPHQVHKTDYGALYVECDMDKHLLVGQLDDYGYLIGLTKPEW